MHIGIIGGGIIGLLSAYELIESGIKISIFEQGNTGKESSWAGGGIISPLYPWRYSHPITTLANHSEELYKPLTKRIYNATNIDPELYQCGIYWLDIEDIQAALSWANLNNFKTTIISNKKLINSLPFIAPNYASALHSPQISNIRNPRLAQSLKKYLLKQGAQLHENCTVRGIFSEKKRWKVKTELGDINLDKIVVATGAWSGELLATLGLSLPVEPVKGQMILYKCEPGFLPSMVLAKGRYAIPRRDGHILVGSTLEHEGFDKTPTDVARESLQASAEELIPALAKQPIVGHWAGLRPGSPDGIPFIGPVPGFEGLWLNCGHYRNGLVLAPASCRLLADLMLGREPIVDPTPYAPSARL